MAKSPNQKLKLLYLYQILLQRTDEEHPITVPQLIGELDLPKICMFITISSGSAGRLVPCPRRAGRPAWSLCPSSGC